MRAFPSFFLPLSLVTATAIFHLLGTGRQAGRKARPVARNWPSRVKLDSGDRAGAGVARVTGEKREREMNAIAADAAAAAAAAAMAIVRLRNCYLSSEV